MLFSNQNTFHITKNEKNRGHYRYFGGNIAHTLRVIINRIDRQLYS